VIVAVAIMRMMEMPSDRIVRVITIRNRLSDLNVPIDVSSPAGAAGLRFVRCLRQRPSLGIDSRQQYRTWQVCEAMLNDRQPRRRRQLELRIQLLAIPFFVVEDGPIKSYSYRVMAMLWKIRRAINGLFARRIEGGV
jgi:hypothetical protein